MLREEMKRIIDIIFSLIGIVVLLLPTILIGILIKFTSEGPIVHWSKRYGKNKKIFFMPKFRTMKENAPQIETELLPDPQNYLTPIGKFLRKFSLDEIPQLYSVLVNEMSIVGPRPALFTQTDLIILREKQNINSLLPGITGLAQVMGRDNLTNAEKVHFDYQYLKKKSLSFDILIILKTFIYVIISKNINH